mgnify:CR=1 FL=1
MVIYKITNLLNEKIYIGQKKQSVEKRFLQHSKADSPIGQAMRKCEVENFTIEIIERCKNQTELNEREIFWIKVLKSKSPNGYNLSNGGAGFIRQKNFSNNLEGMSFSNRLKDLRMARQISQKDFAKRLGVSQQTVASWEVGRTEPANDSLKDIADYFNVSTDYLLGRDNFNQNTSLSNEEKNLLRGFDSLTADGKNLLIGIVNSLIVSHSRKNPDKNSRIIQSNSDGSNFLVTGGENHSFNVTSV